MNLLIASDLSARSDVALQRALSLAAQLNAELSVLHVIDGDLPQSIQNLHKDNARDVLHDAIKASGSGHKAVKVLVRSGDPFHTICEVANEMAADLIVLGSHRKDFLKDLFVGTTIERVMRTSRRPVLMVKKASTTPYRKPVVAVDLSPMTPVVLQSAKKLGLFQPTGFSVVHAFLPFSADRLSVIGPEEDVNPELVAQHKQLALQQMTTAVNEEGLSAEPHQLIAESGEAAQVVKENVQDQQADLLVMGTSGHGGVKRMLIGSVASQLLREVECDMLAVPYPE